MKSNITYLKKQIIYKCYHSWIKETDILYKRIIINNIDKLNNNDLELISEFFNDYNDYEIYQIFTHNKDSSNKYSKLIEKLLKMNTS